MATIRALALMLGVFSSLGGCGSSGCGPVDPDPCELDRLGCGGDPVDFPHLDDCAVTEPLAVSLGEGTGGFAPLGAGARLVLHVGLQGAQHYFVGFRVENPALDLYDQLKVTLWVGQGEACDLGDHPEGLLPEGCDHDLGYREVVIGGDTWPLNVVDGVVEEGDLLVVVDYPWSGLRTVAAVEVEDPCGRTGAASVIWTQP